MITLNFDEVLKRVYNAKKGVEVRYGLGQGFEYCKQFADEAQGYATSAKASEKKATDAVAGIEQTKADAVQAVQQAQTTAVTAVQEKQTAAEQAVDTAQTSALESIGTARAGALEDVAASTKAAANAAAEAGAAKTAAAGSASAAASAAGAAASAAGAASTSESNAAASAERAEAAAKKAEAVVGTDKTLTMEGAPADAAAVGEALGKKADASQVQDEKGEVRFYSKADVDKLLAQCKTDTMLASHPVKSWYFSDDPTSPAAIFGGMWEQHTDGRSLIGAGGAYTVGSTGGEATHTLSVDEMPRHGHPYYGCWFHNGDGNVQNAYDNKGYWGAVGEDNQRRYSGDIGNSKPHNNMSPYYATYIWQRVE